MTPRRSARVPGRWPTAPYLEAIVSYGFRGSVRFHVPGHKGGPGADPGLRSAIGDRALALDIAQDIEGIDVGPRPTPYEQAELLAAVAYDAGTTWFLTNGATQGNHALILALAKPGDHVLVQRNSHASIVDGLVLSGGRASFVAPEYDDELGMAHGVTPAALAQALDRSPDISAAFIVSPTYYGMAADVEGCARVAHERDVALDRRLRVGVALRLSPRSARLAAASRRRCRARLDAQDRRQPDPIGDAARRARRLDRPRRDRPLHPPGPLDQPQLAAAGLAGLGSASALRARRGAARPDDRGVDARPRGDRRDPGIELVGAEFVGRPGIAGWDPLRIVIDVRGTGCTGYELAAELRARYDIYIELATHATIVLVLGLGQPVEPLERFAHDFAETVRILARPGEGRALATPPAPAEQETVVPIRDAFLGRGEAVPVDEAIGRISCESIAGYPPGVPSLLPGERVTEAVVAYLRALTAAGARLHGAADPTFTTVRVLVDRGAGEGSDGAVVAAQSPAA